MAHKIPTVAVNETSKPRADHGVVPESQHSDSDPVYTLGYLPDLGNDYSDEIESVQSEHDLIMHALQNFLSDDNLSDEETVEQSAQEHEEGMVQAIFHTELILIIRSPRISVAFKPLEYPREEDSHAYGVTTKEELLDWVKNGDQTYRDGSPSPE
ncbi:hypothetical protein EDB85DRAFT_2143133 [Lactarius pseudohatsudake]|nr:hypothetical protein EDB85DRAFT_2143133 [Lactarius pseudohatsudake]